MGSVMVGLDGSPTASAASRWAARLAAATGSELVLASAWRSAQAEGTAEDVELQRKAARIRLEDDWCAPARAAGATPRAMLLEGPPDVLLDAAEAEHAELLVVGNRGAGGFASLHLGSVAHHLARHTARPLAVVPQSSADRLPDTIVVGVDGSPGSTAAIRWCADTAPVLGARVVAVLAFEPFLEWVPADDPASWYRDAERDVERWVAPLRQLAIDVEVVVVRDIHPVPAIAAAATRHGAGLVVVGTRGRGGFAHLHLGSVALQVVHHTGLAVVLVPPAAYAGNRSLPDAEQVDHEHEGLPAFDDTTGAGGAVTQARRDGDAAAPADAHAGDTVVPAFDDLTGAEPEAERLAPVPGGVELLAGAPGDPDVVHLDLLARLGQGAAAFLDVLRDQIGRRGLPRRDVDVGLVVGGHDPEPNGPDAQEASPPAPPAAATRPGGDGGRRRWRPPATRRSPAWVRRAVDRARRSRR